MPKQTIKKLKDCISKHQVTVDVIELYTDAMYVQMPHDRHDPLIAAVALFNVKYYGETVRIWYTSDAVTNYRSVLQWDLGKLAYKFLTYDEAGTKEFLDMDFDALVAFSEFKPPLELAYCNVNDWNAEGRSKVDALLKEHPPRNFRIKADVGTKANTVVYHVVECGTTGRISKNKQLPVPTDG